MVEERQDLRPRHHRLRGGSVQRISTDGQSGTPEDVSHGEFLSHSSNASACMHHWGRMRRRASISHKTTRRAQPWQRPADACANAVVHGNPSLRQYWGSGVHKPLAKFGAMAMPLCTEIGRENLERAEAVARHV